MNIPRSTPAVSFLASNRVLVVLTVLLLGGFCYGKTSNDEREPEPPARPDLSEMTTEQATVAMEKYAQTMKAYTRASEEWYKRTMPRREQAYMEEVAKAQERKLKREKSGSVLESASENGVSKLEADADYDWERDAQAQGLDEEVRAQLKRDSLVIAGRDFPQSFSVYGDEATLPFVTSDSLLNGFHILLEASLKKFELRRSAQLREVLEGMWENLYRRLNEEKVLRAQVEPYIRHMARVTGPALRLLGSTVPLGDPALEADVDAVVNKVKAAQSAELPQWMEPAEPGLHAIDFRRCRPLGFYAESPVLSDYYRAVRWLQLVPMRATRENEAGAAALMADVSSRHQRGLPNYVEQGEAIWGEEDGATVKLLSEGRNDFLKMIAQDGNTMRAVKTAGEQITDLNRWNPVRINDRLRTASGQAADAAVQMLAGTVLPDSLLLESLMGKRPAGKNWPQGLEIAAWLGSDFALQNLQQREELAGTIGQERDSQNAKPEGDATVPQLYYYALRALFESPDSAAPAFMRSEAWQRKSVQTALAGWAQLRHAWELQTKLNISFTGAYHRPAGLIEPNPVFFQRMSRVEAALIVRFQDAGVFADTASDETEFLRGEVKKLERLGLGKVEVDMESVDSFEYDRIFELPYIVSQSNPSVEYQSWQKLAGVEQISYWQRVIQGVRERIARLERRERVPAISSNAYRFDGDRQLFSRWQLLQTLTGRLEAMVQKQLRGADWNEEEAGLLKSYGEGLGEIMGYFSSATMMPKDDAPRWTTVFHNPVANQNLAVAIGRARALYVLYPWQGKTILCRGAVMSYYEYPSENRLIDLEWKQLLDSPEAPAQPDWIQPLVSPVAKRQ